MAWGTFLMLYSLILCFFLSYSKNKALNLKKKMSKRGKCLFTQKKSKRARFGYFGEIKIAFCSCGKRKGDVGKANHI